MCKKVGGNSTVGPTEKPGAILTQVRVPGSARDFFCPSESASSADSLTVSEQPP